MAIETRDEIEADIRKQLLARGCPHVVSFRYEIVGENAETGQELVRAELNPKCVINEKKAKFIIDA